MVTDQKGHASRHGSSGSDTIDAGDLGGGSGTSGQILQTDGSVASWVTFSSGASVSDDGSTVLTSPDDVNYGGSHFDVSDDGDGTATVQITSGSIGTNEMDLSMSPTWTGNHEFDGGLTIGTFEVDADSGNVQLINMPVTSGPGAGSEQSIGMALDSVDVLTLYSEADGAGGTQNVYIDANSNPIQNVTDPTNNQDAATKNYVDTNKYTDEEAQDAVGTIVTGGNALTATYDDAGNSISYAVDSNSIQTDELDLSISPTWTSSHTFNNGLDAGSSRISSVSDPVSPQDAATKNYADAIEQGLVVKDSVRVASTSNEDLTTAGDGAIDGVTLNDGDRVLLKDQNTASENGIYVANTATDRTTWTRSNDADEDAEVKSGMFMFVEEGTVHGDESYILITDDPITVDTTSLDFTVFSKAGEIVAGEGLSKSGNTLDVRLDVDDSGTNITNAYGIDFDSLLTVTDDTDNTVTVSVDEGSISHDSIDQSTVSADDHHTKYTDENAQDAVGNIMSGSGATTVTYDDAGNTITVDSTDTDTHTDISESGTTVVSDVSDINFTQSNDASVSVTDDADGSVTVDVDVTDTNTDTQTDVSDNDTTVVSSVGDINFSSNLSVTDDADGTVTVNATDTNTDTRTDVSEAGTTVVSEVTDINFTQSNDATVNVTDDTDGTVTVDVDVTDSNTTYSAGTGVDLATTTFSLDESYGPTWTGTHDFTGANVDLPTASAPSQTTEGRVQWDTDDDRLTVGTGSSTSQISSDSVSAAHHSKTSSASELTDVSADSVSDAHHTRPSAGVGLTENSNAFDFDGSVAGSNLSWDGTNDVLNAAIAGDTNQKVYHGSFVISGTGDINITGVPFQPNQVQFKASLPVDAESLPAKSGDSSNDDTGFAGNMFGFARQSDGTQKAMSTGGSGNSINNIRYGASDTKAIYATYGDQNANQVAQIEGTLSSWNTDGFTVNIDTYSSVSAAMAGQVVHYVAYRSEELSTQATDIEDSGGIVVADAGGVQFTGSNDATVSVTDDGDNTATVDVDVTDTDTTYSAGTALGLSGTTFNFNQTLSQGGTSQITGPTDINFTSSGSASVTVTDDTDGTATVDVSATDNDTTYSAGTGLNLSSTTFSLDASTSDLNDAASPNATAAGQTLIWNATNGQFENSTLTGGSNVSITNGDASITIDATDTDTQLTNEEVQDIVGPFVTGGTNVTTTYDDAGNSLTIDATDTDTTYSAGDGLSLSGTTFSAAIDVDDSGTNVIGAHGINFGNNLSVTDDTDGTVTVDASGGGGVDVADTGTVVTSSSSELDFTGPINPSDDGDGTSTISLDTTGIDSNVVSGTAGGQNYLAQWNSDGDLIDPNVTLVGGSTATLRNQKASGTWAIEGTDAVGNPISLLTLGGGSVDVHSTNITNVTDPSNAQDAATKNYVDFTVSDSTTSVMTLPDDINFGDNLSVTDDTDGTVTVDASASSGSVDVANSGTVVTSGSSEVNFNNGLTASDDGDSTSTVDLDESYSATWTSNHEFDGGLTVGTLEIDTDAGDVQFINMPVSNTPAQGTEQSIGFALDGADQFTLYSEADGAGGLQNVYLDANSNRIKNVTDPTDAQDAATKSYADGKDVSIADSGTQTLPATDDINFGQNLTVTDDGDGTVTIDASGGSGHSVSDSGTSVLAGPDDVNFGSNLTVSDDGDNTVTVDASSGTDLTVQDDGTGVVSITDTLDLAGSDFNVTNPVSGEAQVEIDTDAVNTDEIDLSISPTWTGTHHFDAGQDTDLVRLGNSSGTYATFRYGPDGDIPFDIYNGSTRNTLFTFWHSLGIYVNDTMTFQNITGTPTFAGHDHSSGGMTAIGTGGIADAAVTEAKLDVTDTASDGEVLSWNNTAGQFEWVAQSGGSSLDVQEGGTSVASTADTLDFVGTDFNLTSPTTDEAEVSLNTNDSYTFPSGDGTNNQVLKTDGAGTVTWQDEVESFSHDGGAIEVADGESNSEINRIALQSGETLVVDRIETRLVGGGSSASVSARVQDITAASTIGSQTAGGTTKNPGSSGTANTVAIQVSNSSGSVQDVIVRVHGRITGA